MSNLRNESTDVEPGVREIILAEDVSATVRSLHDRVDTARGLDDYDTERFGGVVVGKTLFHGADYSTAIIVMDASILRSGDDVSRTGEIYVLCHELAHAMIGQIRRANGNPVMAASFLPWEVSRWYSRYALEEYRADRIAQTILALMGTVTVD